MFPTQTLGLRTVLSVLCVVEEMMQNSLKLWSCCWVLSFNGCVFYRLILTSTDKYECTFCASLKSPLKKNPYPRPSLSCCAGSYRIWCSHTAMHSGQLQVPVQEHPAHTGSERSSVPSPAASPAQRATCPASICVPGHLATWVDANSANGEVAAQ